MAGMSVPYTEATSAVLFHSPGTPTALRALNVYIRADYSGGACGDMHALGSFAYALSPGGDAVALSYVDFSVFAGGLPTPGRPGVYLAGAVVEVLDGVDAGQHCETVANGSCSLDFLHLNAPFTVRASKAGYSTDVRVHPGISVGAEGFPEHRSLSFSIDPL
jgi:hypothetical protein